MSESAARKPVLLRAGEGESVWSLGGRFTANVTAAEAEDRFALVEALAFQSTEPPLHIDGKMTFYVGDEVLEATSGCFVYAPRGIPHTFTVDREPTRVLVFASPTGFEHFALELGDEAADDTPPADLSVPHPEVLGPVAERYGIEVVGPLSARTDKTISGPPTPAVGRGRWGRSGDGRSSKCHLRAERWS